MTRAISLSIIALVAALSACGVEPARGPAPGDDPGSPQVDQQAVTSSDTADPASSTSPTEGVITPRAGCSVVQFCNAPGSEGTTCQQQGCSVQSAVSECKSEVPGVCGSPVSPWIFITSNGVHHPSTASCILSNRCGGQAPAGCFCDSACTSFGDCCFDGPC